VLGRQVDVEWALAGDRIWVLQARPVTVAAPESPAASTATAATVLAGTPGSPGTATGPARVLTGPADFARATAMLSHAAIVAREHGIPAVLGIPGAMTAMRDGLPVTVRALYISERTARPTSTSTSRSRAVSRPITVVPGSSESRAGASGRGAAAWSSGSAVGGCGVAPAFGDRWSSPATHTRCRSTTVAHARASHSGHQ
jgi:hypothetical protein